MGSLVLAGVQLKPADGHLYLHPIDGRYGEHLSSAEWRGDDTTVPGLEGRLRRNRVFDRLVIVLEGYVQGIGVDVAARRSNFRSTFTTLSPLFDPRHAVMTLVDTLEDGTTKTAHVYFESAPLGELNKSGYYRTITVNLISYEDPVWT